MADISDVEQSIANCLTDILYPSSTAAGSIIGSVCRIYRGWPNTATLNADLKNGIINISVSADHTTGRTTTRYLPEWMVSQSAPGTVITTSTDSVTVAGSPLPGDLAGASIDGKTFVYQVQPGDDAALVAANLNRLIGATRASALSGTTILIPGARSIIVRSANYNTASFESRRQEKDIRIMCWCPSPDTRDAVAVSLDEGLNRYSFLTLGDGSSARFLYTDTEDYDQSQNSLLYRRDLVYRVEYPTVISTQQPAMIFGASVLNGNTTYG